MSTEFDEDDRDLAVLEDIADEFETTPEALIEGTVEIRFREISDNQAYHAQLCRCQHQNCGQVVGCEHAYCFDHR